MSHLIRERLRSKLLVKKILESSALKPVQEKQFREILAQELFDSSITKKLSEKKTINDYKYDEIETPIPAICIEVLFELLLKYRDIEKIEITMKDGKVIHQSLGDSL